MHPSHAFQRIVASIALLSVMPAVCLAERQVSGGAVRTLGPVTIVHVSGTPQQMGHAHGHLLAEEITTYLNESAANLFGGDAQTYNLALSLVVQAINIPPDDRAEIAAILDGVKAAKGELPLHRVANRPISVDDLLLANAFDAIRSFGCSGFTVWGHSAGEAGLITARNFDFSLISSSATTPRILVRSPSGKRSVATIAPPGYIGAFTGVNEDGVCAFMHDGDGPQLQTPSGKYTPLALALKNLLESAAPDQALSVAEKNLRAIAPYPFSYMARIVAPRQKDQSSPPARVFRVDAKGFGENSANGSMCLTTNHYLPALDGVTGSGSAARYDRLARLTQSPMTPETTWQALLAVAAADPRNTATLHSIVVYPEQRRLEVAFATTTGAFTPAPMNKPVRVTFEELFDRKADDRLREAGKLVPP